MTLSSLVNFPKAFFNLSCQAASQVKNRTLAAKNWTQSQIKSGWKSLKKAEATRALHSRYIEPLDLKDGVILTAASMGAFSTFLVTAPLFGAPFLPLFAILSFTIFCLGPLTVKKRLQNKATLEITSLYPLFITELEKVETSSAEIERLRGKIRQIETKRLCDHLQESLLKPFDQHRRRYLDNLSSGNLKNQTEVKKAFIAYLKQAQKLAE